MNRKSRMLLACVVAVLALSGCERLEKLRKQDLERLRSWYPGTYSNVSQVEADMANGVADVREPVVIVIVPVAALATGDTVFYVQQSDAMNPQRLLSQRLHRFEKGPKDVNIVQTILTLKQPERWVNGAQQPDIFKSIRPDDVLAGPGCALAWTYENDKFTATCPVAPTAGAPPVHVELTQTELKLATLSFNGKPRDVPSRSGDPMYRFERQ
jgi:hypothetical protein